MPRPKLLVIDTAYTYETICKRGMRDALTSLELDGYFEHVWTVHPVATLTTGREWTSPYGRFVEHRVNNRHIFIEGKAERLRVLRPLFVLNFLLSQIELLIFLRHLIRREGIDVIRAGDPLYSGLLTWVLSRLAGIPFIIRLGANHDKFYEVVGQPLMPRLFRWRKLEKLVETFVMRRAALVAGANEDYAAFARASGVRPDRVTVFPYGNLIDRSHFEDPRNRATDDESAFVEMAIDPGQYLLYIGRLLPGKRPADVLKVLAELRNRGHDLKAVLVGEGELRRELEAEAGELGVVPYVVFAGSRSQQWLAEIIPGAAAVLSPTTGRALSEAALGGAPIVAYDTDWQGEIIKTGETGELVPYGDWMAMADSAEKLLTDSRYASAMGAGARRTALKMFDRPALIGHERKAYAQVIQKIGSSKRQMLDQAS